jgi:hypothetical protein
MKPIRICTVEGTKTIANTESLFIHIFYEIRIDIEPSFCVWHFL